MHKLFNTLSCVALLAAIPLTLIYAGVWRDLPGTQGIFGVLLTCYPFGIFLIALRLASGAKSAAVAFLALAFAIYSGVSAYYEAFWAPVRSDGNGIVILLAPAVQAVIGLACVAVAGIGFMSSQRQLRRDAQPVAPANAGRASD